MDSLIVFFAMGYMMQFVGQAFLVRGIIKSCSIDGLNLDGQIMLMISTLCRVFWFMDTSLYELKLVIVEVAVSIAIQGYILYLFYKHRHSQYLKIKSFLNIYTLLPSCFLLSFLMNPSESWFSLNDILISFSFYLESLAMLPQIYQINKLRQVDVRIGNYLTSLAFARLIRIIFWLRYAQNGEYFLSLLFADILHTLVLADFLWLYLKNKSKSNMIII